MYSLKVWFQMVLFRVFMSLVAADFLGLFNIISPKHS